jgi:hypothetical protein
MQYEFSAESLHVLWKLGEMQSVELPSLSLIVAASTFVLRLEWRACIKLKCLHNLDLPVTECYASLLIGCR